MLECYKIMLLEPASESDTALGKEDFTATLPQDMRAVLERFRPVFDPPTGMPPVRAYDHRVHLLPGSKPINVRPYRYLYFQKNEIERQV